MAELTLLLDAEIESLASPITTPLALFYDTVPTKIYY